MDFIYWVGFLVLLLSLITVALVFYADSDIFTLLAERYGKDPATTYRGKVVWITGSSSGIGEALAKELAGYGAKLVLSARRKEELERVKKDCLGVNKSLSEKDILIQPLDVTDTGSHGAILAQIDKHFGTLDVLISNAGIGAKRGELWQDGEVLNDKKLFDVNVFSILSMNRLVVNYFLERGIAGQLGVISSVAARLPSALTGPYSASKMAVNGYFHALRLEMVDTNVDVSIICPGPVSTPILNKDLGETVTEGEKFASGILVMTPQRCARLSLVAMANSLAESWISRAPVLQFVYISTYFPVIMDFLQTKFFARLALKERLKSK